MHTQRNPLSSKAYHLERHGEQMLTERTKVGRSEGTLPHISIAEVIAEPTSLDNQFGVFPTGELPASCNMLFLHHNALHFCIPFLSTFVKKKVWIVK